MNRRERKKKRCGEYTELGFSVDVLFKPECDEKAINEFADQFIDLIEANNMCCGGGWNSKTLGLFVTSDIHRGNSKRLYLSVTHKQRNAVYDWCNSRSEKMEKLHVSDLVDSWNDHWDIDILKK